LRSSPPQNSHIKLSDNIPLSGWHRLLQKTKEVADDLMTTPPPGWKPPKEERDAWRAAHGPSTLQRAAGAARQAAKIIMTPPFQPESPPSPRRDTGARPKRRK
jgi:hypothetical protein